MTRIAITIDVVIPLLNEEGVLPALRERLLASIATLGFSCRFLFIDDGSTDKTYSLLKQFHSEDQRFVAIKLSRNFGHQQAIATGLRFTRADIVLIMDADLQDPPEMVEEMYSLWQDGYDVVYTVRRTRKGNVLKRICYYLYYRILQTVSDTEIPLDSGDCCLLDRRVVSVLNALPERTRFIRGLRSWVGFRQARLEFDRETRLAGEPKYSLPKLFRLALDGILNFSRVPLRLATLSGLAAVLFGILYLFYVGLAWMMNATSPRGFISLAVLIIFFGGVQLLSIGIIGEYVGQVFDEVKGRPLTVVSESVGLRGSDLLDGNDRKQQELVSFWAGKDDLSPS